MVFRGEELKITLVYINEVIQHLIDMKLIKVSPKIIKIRKKTFAGSLSFRVALFPKGSQ